MFPSLTRQDHFLHQISLDLKTPSHLKLLKSLLTLLGSFIMRWIFLLFWKSVPLREEAKAPSVC